MFCIGAGVCGGTGHDDYRGIDGSGMIDFRKIEMMMETRLSNKVGAANAGWPSLFRFRGPRHRSGVADLARWAETNAAG